MINQIKQWWNNLVLGTAQDLQENPEKLTNVGFPSSFAAKMTKIRNLSIGPVKGVDYAKLLKAAGWKVKIKHLRFFGGLYNPQEDKVEECLMTKYQFNNEKIYRGHIGSHNEYEDLVSPTGGKTEVILISPTGEEYRGVAQCSHSDHFSRPQGRNWAIWRALYKSNLTTEEKKALKVLELSE